MTDYAQVIIDIAHRQVDRTFQYRIPPELTGSIHVGSVIQVPFGRGNHLRKGYVVGIGHEAEIAETQIKDVAGVVQSDLSVESQLIQVAWWMKERYGATMAQALATVLPVKSKVKKQQRYRLCLAVDEAQLALKIREAKRKNHKAQLRLLEAFEQKKEISMEEVTKTLKLSLAAVKPLAARGIITIEAEAIVRNPLGGGVFERDKVRRAPVRLNPEQQQAVDGICRDYQDGIRKTYLLHGITGSGKTEVYMELIDFVLKQGREVIVLIPEIALTYQTVMRFYTRFGEQVSFVHSKLSAGERHDQFERARSKEVRMMIGPRTALFTPFFHLGLIIIDEEHEQAYKSEVTPRYHAVDVANYRAKLAGASLVLGSATPSLESYTRAVNGLYGYVQMKTRAKADSLLPKVQVIDMRQELLLGNKSIFSHTLNGLILEKLGKHEQIMLFLNRRGYSGMVSCRSCGEALKCPHCDVSLTLHQNGRMICHYCGYEINRPKTCPSCQSPYLAPFNSGTQKIEELAKAAYPTARILRMDFDTTRKKGGHEDILSAFARHQADILIGTQMIVKGHDFPDVTLVGVLAADLSLYAPDYKSSERTFQLLTQAAGRAGRDERPGDVVIQTYKPEHYCIETAALHDYEGFYQREMQYRQKIHYPPACVMMILMVSGLEEEQVIRSMDTFYQQAGQHAGPTMVEMVGPVNAPIYKLNDFYRKILFLKSEKYDILISIRNHLEEIMSASTWRQKITLQFDFL